MSETKEFDMAYWIIERYFIKLRREAGLPPPWTTDWHMGTVRYCNVHREDDAVTQWMRTNWTTAESPAWKFVLGRMLNYVPTLEKIQPLADRNNIKEVMKQIRAKKEKIFTSVYTISTCGKSMDKIDYVIDWVVQAVAQAGDPDYSTLADACENFTCIDGLGTFLAAQVIADMKNTKGHPLADAPDWWTWCAPGPGSIKGLAAFFGGSRGITPTNFHRNMEECRQLVDPLIPDYIPRISAQDFQNCLCEFSKYMRVKNDNGHVRNRYHAA